MRFGCGIIFLKTIGPDLRGGIMMAETWCGKTCTDCEVRAKQECPGCMAGPGRRFGGSCGIYRCCASKGHETCLTCTQHSNCGTYRGRLRMPEERRKQLEREAAVRMKMAQSAPFFGKWLWILFWLVVPSEIAGLMTNDTVADWFPSLYLPGLILQIICSLVYGLVLLQLAKEEPYYRAAGICSLIATALSGLTLLLGEGWEALSVVAALPALVLSLVSDYHEFVGHAEILHGYDEDMAESWRKLWKWNIGVFAGTVGGILLVFVAPILAVIVVLVTAVVALVVSIMRLVYLYRTAQLFRRYPTETASL